MANRVDNFSQGKGGPVTPAELGRIAQNLVNLRIKLPDLGGVTVGEIGSTKEAAKRRCYLVSEEVHPFLPEGSHVMVFSKISGNKTDLHASNIVPTTEGPHVVDFTHRQFDSTSPFPLVEPLQTFLKRKPIKELFVSPETEFHYTTHYRATEEHRLDAQNKMPFDRDGQYSNNFYQ